MNNKTSTLILSSIILLASTLANASSSLNKEIKAQYNNHLKELFLHFHKNPELSLQEFKTAARMAKELRAEGFTVTENVGGTGVAPIF